jgi:hypothetical protein
MKRKVSMKRSRNVDPFLTLSVQSKEPTRFRPAAPWLLAQFTLLTHSVNQTHLDVF